MLDCIGGPIVGPAVDIMVSSVIGPSVAGSIVVGTPVVIDPRPDVVLAIGNIVVEGS